MAICLMSHKSLYPRRIRPVDPIVFNRIRVRFHRKTTSFVKNRSDPTKTPWDPIEIIQIRQHPTPHESPGTLKKLEYYRLSVQYTSICEPHVQKSDLDLIISVHRAIAVILTNRYEHLLYITLHIEFEYLDRK
jgi:hypothetical protein